MSRWRKTRTTLVTMGATAAILALALWPDVTPVTVATLERGPLTVTVDEEGRTRIRHRFVVSAPLSGRMTRIAYEPGDRVARGDVVARIRSELPSLLDVRTEREARAAVESARAALALARAERERARASLDQAERDLHRHRLLLEAGALAPQEVERAETGARVAAEAAKAADFSIELRAGEVKRAEARLVGLLPGDAGRTAAVAAPVDGVVLRRFRESESFVSAGEPLLELGDPAALEVVADVLSTDAVQIAVDARVVIERWGHETPLAARVRLVEPSGFTKISALGVEEQRVNVVMAFADPQRACAELGDAYRVEVRIVLWEADDVLKVPTSALFRSGEGWGVFEVEAGRVRRRPVDIGHRNGREAEVLAGLRPGARVVVHPGDTLEDGARVIER